MHPLPAMARELVLENLIVWQLACAFEDGVIDLVNATTAARDYKFAGQITDAATGVPSNVSEGFHRFSAGEFAVFIKYSRSCLAEAEKRLKTGVRKRHFTQAQIDPLLVLGKRLGKGLTNFQDYLERKAAEKKARRQSGRHRR